MKYFVLSPDARGNIDPVISDGILAHLPGRVTDMTGADCVIVPVCYCADYRFNEALIGIFKPIILIDFTEYGWDAGAKPNLLGGGNIRSFGHLDSDEWGKLDKWAANNPPRLHLKRELHSWDVDARTRPIDFPCRVPAREIETRERFDARTIEVFSAWGLSHPFRQKFHGQVFQCAHNNGFHVIDGWDQREEGTRTWASIHAPHYLRKPMAQVMDWNHRAKISVSLPGAGVKCFRSAEAPVGSVMALCFDEMAWSYPWENNDNCIRLSDNWEVPGLLECLRSAELYNIYRRGQETIDRYRCHRYAIDYVRPAIQSVL